MSYEQFAKTYDALMDSSIYDRFEQFVNRYARPGQSILDVGCGNGELARRLENTYRMLGCDLSENMLALASEKTRKTQLFQADMTNFKLENSVDMVTCFTDTICYLENIDAVKQAFRCAYDVLKIDGIYLFDTHSIYQMEKGYRDFQFQHVDDESIFVWEVFEGDEPFSVIHEISCVNRLKNGLYERYDETHFERTYPLMDYIEALKNVGFRSVEAFADFGTQTINDTTDRWFFVAKK